MSQLVASAVPAFIMVAKADAALPSCTERLLGKTEATRSMAGVIGVTMAISLSRPITSFSRTWNGTPETTELKSVLPSGEGFPSGRLFNRIRSPISQERSRELVPPSISEVLGTSRRKSLKMSWKNEGSSAVVPTSRLNRLILIRLWRDIVVIRKRSNPTVADAVFPHRLSKDCRRTFLSGRAASVRRLGNRLGKEAATIEVRYKVTSTQTGRGRAVEPAE